MATYYAKHFTGAGPVPRPLVKENEGEKWMEVREREKRGKATEKETRGMVKR